MISGKADTCSRAESKSRDYLAATDATTSPVLRMTFRTRIVFGRQAQIGNQNQTALPPHSMSLQLSE